MPNASTLKSEARGLAGAGAGLERQGFMRIRLFPDKCFWFNLGIRLIRGRKRRGEQSSIYPTNDSTSGPRPKRNQVHWRQEAQLCIERAVAAQNEKTETETTHTA